MSAHARVIAILVLLALLPAACSTSPEDVSGTAPADDAAVPTAGAAPVQGELPTDVELGPGAVTTASGLRYEDVAVGAGETAESCRVVAVHYDGALTDGTPFDSSRASGTPFAFILGAGQVIPGWDEGVAGMQVGGVRRLVVPSDLAYGPAGSGSIPPDATLVFDVEVLEVSPEPSTMPDGPEDGVPYETTPSGLELAVLREGDGPEAVSGQRVFVHYTGWLEDGTPFDSSLGPDRCGPLQFQLGSSQVIRGWDEGVQGMRVGERRQLRIPPDLAYGESGTGPIPPNAVLIFDVELVSAR